MIRICNSLVTNGYAVLLVGCKVKSSTGLVQQVYSQKRLFCFFSNGKGFYIEYNLRLFFFLLFQKADCVCAIDLDTIIPCYGVSVIKNIPRAYDAHELFCEMKEIISRPRIYSLWKKIEKFSVPKFQFGYTVNKPIADEFKKMYGVDYTVIRNFPVLYPLEIPAKKEKYILYQGAVNEGRSFETLIPAMLYVDNKLIICGDGNFMDQAKQLVREHNLTNKVIFKGKFLPSELKEITKQAWIGITLFENKGLSNYLSLANRFSDYLHAGIPQLCVDYPVYREINDQYNVAVLLSNLEASTIAKELNSLLTNETLYRTLQENCVTARESLNWQQEEKKLISFYQNILADGG
jgi:glycosyltransferase involved in cell wall biosynthesis